jgi:hypothetical protein
MAVKNPNPGEDKPMAAEGSLFFSCPSRYAASPYDGKSLF